MSSRTIIFYGLLAIVIALYGFAYWCEAAYGAGQIGFTEVITWARMKTSLAKVAWEDMADTEYRFMDMTFMFGVILLAALAGINDKRWRNAAAVVLASYVILITLFGAWKCIFAVLLFPAIIRTIDGEFLTEGWPCMTVYGLWMLIAIGFVIVAWPQEWKWRHRMARRNPEGA